MSTPQIGQPVSRLEGPIKVTGQAKYSGEYNVEDLLYGYVINSTITKGKIVSIDYSEAESLPGVVKVITYKNKPSTAWFSFKYGDMDAPPGTPFKPLSDDQIVYNGQPIALVVADTFEMARYAACLVKIEYNSDPFTTDLQANIDAARDPKKGIATALKPLPPKPVGDFDKAYADSKAKASGKFIHGTEHHNPLELFTTTTVYNDGKLVIYDKTQGTINSQLYIANVFGLHLKDVQVISPYVGGGFGSGLRPQYQLFLSVMAALDLKRNVRVTLDRSQMFTFGYRPATMQRTFFGANEEGKVTALSHLAIAETSQFEDYTEVVVNWSHILYPAKNTSFDYKLIPLDVASPLDMRAPGGSTAMHAIESTMDELAANLDMDPLQFRLINYADKDVSVDRPFSSKELKQCYLQGAAKFGWDKRSAAPRSMKKGNKLIGYGMATGIWESMALPAKAQLILTSDGNLYVKSAVTDIGTGTLTVMTQIAADGLGLPIEKVIFIYGDSKMPFAPIQGGSFTVSSVGSAVKVAGDALRKKIFKIAVKSNSSLKDHKLEDVYFKDGFIYSKKDHELIIDLKDVVAANRGRDIKTTNTAVPKFFKLKRYTRAAHSAAFVEVEVDEELGTINVTRAVTAVAAGKIINPKTARSQIIGGMIWGISKALREETITDHQLGRHINRNLGEYHIPVHADVHDLDVVFVEETDFIINELGSKGVGEIGLVAMSPAIANAIYNATGKRINQFPIHLDALL